MSLLIILILIVSLGFDYINGFHDTANAIATVVSTRVLTPAAAIIMAAILNVAGAMWSTHVATTIAKGIVDPTKATEVLVLAAVIGAICWNLITWVYGIPSSSSHALIGGLIGAALAKAGPSIVTWKGLLDKVVYPLVGSPLVGFIVAYALMSLLAHFFPARQFGQSRDYLSKAATCVIGLHGVLARAKRCAEEHGHHHPRPFHESLHLRAGRSFLGEDRMCLCDGLGYGGRWLADHQDVGTQDHSPRSGPWVCGGDFRRGSYSGGEPLRHADLHDARDHRIHLWRWPLRNAYPRFGGKSREACLWRGFSRFPPARRWGQCPTSCLL